MREYLLSVAPINHADQITKPIFVVQGANDPRVPLSEASGFKDKIKGSNPNVWYLVAKDEGHGFAKKKNADYLMYSSVLFMRKFLLGMND
jgi:dipeptidyl aminopeptidase/acylaminoacyl peptidase